MIERKMLKMAILLFLAGLAQAINTSEGMEGAFLLAGAPYDAHALLPNTPGLNTEEDELPWSAERRLSWEDFQGVPPEDPGEKAAYVYLTISFTWRGMAWFDRVHGNWKARPIEIITSVTMNRRKSWVLTSHKTPELLNHEQKHFDLHEVYRRLLDMAFQRALASLEGQGGVAEEALQDLGEKLFTIFEEVRRKAEDVQSQYDRETEYGRNVEKQRIWDEKISRWLEDPTKAPQPWSRLTACVLQARHSVQRAFSLIFKKPSPAP